MELGNICFGNSRGEYDIDRNRFGELFVDLLEKYNMLESDIYPKTIKTDVFELRPYYWGDCTCDGETADSEWCNNNKHAETCYQMELKKLQEDAGDKAYVTYGFYETQPVKDLLKKHNLPDQGCAVHCTCDYNKKWGEFLEKRGGYHRANCEIIQPNFLYKPANLSIMWYKYPLRDAYSNRPFDEKELKEIFKKIGYQKSDKK